MSDQVAAHLVARYFQAASAMRKKAQRAWDPKIAATYEELAAEWLWLAEIVLNDFEVIDPAEQDALGECLSRSLSRRLAGGASCLRARPR
jgi:hypothetical protein